MQILKYLLISTATIFSLAQSTVSFSAYTGQCSTPQDVQELPPGHWCEVPNSNARSAEKKPQEWDDWNGSSSAKYNSYQGTFGFSAIMFNWSGGAYDSLRDRLLITGGGHKGYGGNEIIAFSLKSLTWERISDPVAYPATNASGAYKNAGPPQSPISRHTYGGLEYIESDDRLYMFGGAGYETGFAVPGTWTFNLKGAEDNGNPATNIQFWELRTSVNEPPTGFDSIAMYDPVTERVFHHKSTSPGILSSYQFSSDTWTQLNSEGHYPDAFGVVDPVKRKIFEFNPSGSGDVKVYNIPQEPITSMSGTVSSTGGDDSIETADDPGVAYDSSIGAIVAYNGGTSVFVFDSTDMTWQEYPASQSNAINPGATTAVGGIFGRFRYSSKKNVYVYVDNVDANVYLYRLAPEPVRPSSPALQVN